MSETAPATESEQTPSESVNTPSSGAERDAHLGNRRNSTRGPRRPNAAFANPPKDFEGVTPKIGGILALRSENMTKKVNF